MICNSPPHSFSRCYISMKQKRGYLSHKYKYVFASTAVATDVF